MTDGLGGILFPMTADGWAEVVGYYVDGCIKVDVYQIDRHDGATYYSELSPYYTSEWTCIISRMIRASGPWAHGRNILVDDGWAGRNIIPDDSGVDEWADVHEYPVDGWAEVVGYHVDGCIKVDVYQIDRRVLDG
ncbi:hypothetical protein BDR07DRAFT_1385346 [Suillus spraguei]|nr:hypothetical protein BDR07DRAFT_1385346 [Suillus spraguei]